MDRYGHLWLLRFPQATYECIWIHTDAYDEYGHLGSLIFTSHFYDHIQLHMSRYGYVWSPMATLIFANYLW